MGIQNDLKPIKNNRKTIFHFVMLTSIVAASASIIIPTAKAEDETNSPDLVAAAGKPAAIPYCDDKAHERSIGRRLLYISTLDGRLTALDITKSGKQRWTIPTGPGPLISSSIHRLELTNNGQFVRMIPSLSGGIYKFDGESIDPIPITTDNLLSSSAKFSDDLVISGGKETRTYGVSARTGQLLYECTMHGCVNATDDKPTKAVNDSSSENHDAENVNKTDEANFVVAHDPHVDDVVVLRRQTQTVRAVESRTGLERWNFSVGQHEVDLLRAADCHDNSQDFSDLDLAVFDVEFKVVVPEGLVCAFSKTDPNMMLWKYKFDHPIVSAWRMATNDELQAIDLFSSAQWLWEQQRGFFDNAQYPATTPSIYLGMYEKQLYIQESIHLRNEIIDQTSLYSHLTAVESTLPKIPWRPIAASSNAFVDFEDDKRIKAVDSLPSTIQTTGNELVRYSEDKYALSAQSVLNASEFFNGNGFFLYTNADLDRNIQDPVCEKNQTPNTERNEGRVMRAVEGSSEDIQDIVKSNKEALPAAGNDSNVAYNRSIEEELGFSMDDIDAPVKVVVLSLWFWWKEIVVIAFTSAVLLNMFFGQRQRAEREIVFVERHVPVATAIEATEASTRALLGPVSTPVGGFNNKLTQFHPPPQRSISESTSNSGEHYTSRFQTDFDLVQCLGRGGFGVVFEAKNKLDENKYAVKRITLPNKESSRQRVLREARTLASCEHHNIVRYFHSWVETPPVGWQEEEDRKLLAHEMSTSIQIETPDGSTLPSLVDSLAKYNDNRLQSHQVDKKRQLLSWVSSTASTACSFAHKPGEACFNGKRELDNVDDDSDSAIIFRSESQSAALREHDDDFENNCTENFHIKAINDKEVNPVSIDIHSTSFDLKNINYTQLSDSFQIEFVRSTGGSDGHNIDHSDHGGNADGYGSDDEHTSTKQSKRKQLSLALATNPNNQNQNNNNHQATLPTAASSSQNRLKPSKVYLYIQMQLCRKESLRDWLRDNTTEARAQHIGNIFHQIVDAVDYVHLKGLIHRDLKPSNIFFSQDGQVKIGDFGLVTDMSDIPNLVTQCGDQTGLPSCARHTQQVGTHLYMSPEQLRGKHYDYKVDIYSLGLIFFELYIYFSTEMERIKTLRDLRDGKYPEDFRKTYPAEYELLQQMLATDPAQRPQTKDLKIQLNELLHLPEHLEDGRSAAAARAEAARRLSRSRTFSSSGE